MVLNYTKEKIFGVVSSVAQGYFGLGTIASSTEPLHSLAVMGKLTVLLEESQEWHFPIAHCLEEVQPGKTRNLESLAIAQVYDLAVKLHQHVNPVAMGDSSCRMLDVKHPRDSRPESQLIDQEVDVMRDVEKLAGRSENSSLNLELEHLL